jgi:uncharacterized damage-inducible protein DinB
VEALRKASGRVLHQLESAIEVILPHDYSKPSSALGGSTIGQHVRHTVEFFQCLQQGMSTGTVNYDGRSHDKLLETHSSLALDAIRSTRRFVEHTILDGSLVLETQYGHCAHEAQTMTTSYFRELAYNLEHTIHHMAIIRIGLRDIAGYVELPEDFGIAASTIRYRRAEVAPQA